MLDELDGIRWQSAVVTADGKKEGVNFFARVQGYDYMVSGATGYDHISLQDVGRKHVHEIERGMKLRKKQDDHVFEVETKQRYKTIDMATLYGFGRGRQDADHRRDEQARLQRSFRQGRIDGAGNRAPGAAQVESASLCCAGN